MAKKKVAKTETTVTSAVKTVAATSNNNYKVRVMCSDCRARTLKSISVPLDPNRGDQLPERCGRTLRADKQCEGTLIIRRIFNKE
jgi:hypothetical protein